MPRCFSLLHRLVAESSSPPRQRHEQDGVHRLLRHVAVKAPDVVDADEDSNSSWSRTGYSYSPSLTNSKTIMFMMRI